MVISNIGCCLHACHLAEWIKIAVTDMGNFKKEGHPAPNSGQGYASIYKRLTSSSKKDWLGF